jgi:hypothetical protein
MDWGMFDRIDSPPLCEYLWLFIEQPHPTVHNFYTLQDPSSHNTALLQRDYTTLAPADPYLASFGDQLLI